MTNFNFGQLATKWWDPDGDMRSLHDINTPRLEFIQKNILSCHKTAFDIGCGAGILTESLAKMNLVTSGIDASKELINIAISHAKIDDLKIQYTASSFEEYTNTEKFDIVTCLELIEHVTNPEELIKALSSFCKPNGRVFISTLNKTLKSWLLGIVAAEHILNIVPKGTHSYEQFIKPSTIKTLASKYQLTLNSACGIDYNPFSRVAKLSNNMDINYILCFSKN